MAVAFHKRPSLGSRALPAVVLVGSLGVLAIAAHLTRDAWMAKPQQDPPAGFRPVLVSAMQIPIYTKITRDYLWDPKKGDWSYIFVDPAEITSNMRPRGPDIIGRVLNHTKPAGYVFTEDDFYPPHTKEGWPAGVPSGWRAMNLQADRIEGIARLKDQDRFDVISTTPIDPRALEGLGKGATTNIQVAQAQGIAKANVRTVVHAGVIVVSLETRQIPIFSQSLFNAASTRGRPIQEVMIATSPDDAVQLAAELANQDAKLTSLPFSNRADDDPRSEVRPKPIDAFDINGTGAGGMTLIDVRQGDTQQYKSTPRAAGK